MFACKYIKLCLVNIKIYTQQLYAICKAHIGHDHFVILYHFLRQIGNLESNKSKLFDNVF